MNKVQDVTIKDFQPINTWEILKIDNNPQDERYVVDMTTQKIYLNENKETIRGVCAFLVIATPISHSGGLILNVINKIAKILVFAHFWVEKEAEASLEERLKDLGLDLLRIVATPIALVGLELAAIYGIINPYDGRKLYATIERAMLEDSCIIPHFQPISL